MLTRAAFKLKDVTSFVINGWSGEVVVELGDGPGIEVESEKRRPTEFWTFSGPRNGVLTCSTNLISTPSLLTAGESPMIIRLPADKRHIIHLPQGYRTVVKMTEAQLFWLTSQITMQLRNRNLPQSEANFMHELYVRLVGRNHDEWDRLGGKYGR